MGLIAKIQEHLPVSQSLSAQCQTVVSAVLFSTLLWFSLIFTMRMCLKQLLSYHRWMFEQRGKMSNTTKVWVVGTPPRPLFITFSCVCVCVHRASVETPAAYPLLGSRQQLNITSLYLSYAQNTVWCTSYNEMLTFKLSSKIVGRGGVSK
ncbi:unnamed protein product [Oncorhynchus mykiss]|uniref:Uncharacterized protein n=1 Tax=Oncorhynchus mykiss TaxID=8022 RepID=A0A060ZU82_ONCMY|nr:unnamed protein product [Oncorhynchus mykiss]